MKTTNQGWGVASLLYGYIVPLSVERVGPFEPHISPYEVVHVFDQPLVRQVGSSRVWVARSDLWGFETPTTSSGPVEMPYLKPNGFYFFVQSALWAGMIFLQICCGF